MTTRLNNILDRLPGLYRPDGDVAGLLPAFLGSVAEMLEEVNRDSIEVLQSHWFRYADQAMLSPFVTHSRELQSLAPSRTGDLIDFVSPASFLARLLDAPDPLSQYLRDQLSPETRRLLDGYQGPEPPSEQLQRGVIGVLNELVRAGPLYDEARFEQVALSQDTRQLLSLDPRGNDLVRLNLRLLEEAYPDGLTRMVQDSRYIGDLGRLAALVSVPPWYEPPLLRDTVESYRTRIRRIIGLYRNGLGTVNALRSMVEAQLPLALNEIQERRDRPFYLEEFAPLVRTVMPMETRGEPEGIVGPLMRWNFTNEGLGPAAPTIYIQGVQPQPGQIDATLRPLVELYRHGSGYPRLGIGYNHDDPVPPGQTLRLRPAYLSWTGADTGIQRSEALPSDLWPADPTAPGPWQAPENAPTAPVAAMEYTHDRVLWVATSNVTETGVESALWRYNGRDWSLAADQLPQVYCLREDGQHLLAGTTEGLRRIFLYPEDGASFTATPLVAELDGRQVYTIFRDNRGILWVGTSEGAARLTPDASPGVVYALASAALQGTEVRAINQDESGAMFFGAPHGLFQYEPLADRWHWYAGEELSDQVEDWKPFTPGALPEDSQVFLPPVTRVHRGPDASLWIGTANGIARYIAHPVRGLTYRTMLEAFPDLVTGTVFDIREDARGLVWFCTQRGLFRYDGRDWWQYQADRWVQLGRADRLYQDTPEPEPRSAWRYHRSLGQWQRWQDSVSGWQNYAPTLRSSPEPAVNTVAWTDYVSADLGAWDGESFTSTEAVDPDRLVVRHKPDEERIVTGGIPAVPRLPVGDAIWRYLSLEPPGLVAEPEAEPYWTVEGRRIPPPPHFTDAPAPARFDVATSPPASNYDESVFAFNPAARVWLSWEPRQPLSVLVRLKKRTDSERIDEAVLDRVWQGVQQVRPAGVRIMLAVEEEIVRGNDHG